MFPDLRTVWHQRFFVVLFHGSKADSDGCAENKMDDCRTVELDEKLLRQFELPELAQKVYTLLCLFDDQVDVRCPI